MRRVFALGLILLLTLVVGAQDGLDGEELDALLADFVYDDEPGTVLFVSMDGDSWVGVAGLADLDSGTPLTTDDLLRIGSATKPFVAVVLLQLVDEGEIALDDLIADYLPEEVVLNVENATDASVREMLQMTSGIFSYTESDAFDDATLDNPTYPWTAAETIEFVYGEDAYFDTGDGYYYSNSNYNLAQMIIESITGNSLADELESRIFAPLGMESCYLETPDRFAQGIVRGYQYGEVDDYEDITEINDGVGLGDGGIVCAAEDLAKFLPALWNGELLEADTLEEMLDTVEDGDGGNYGLGIGYDETDYGMMISHDGATSGFQSTMGYLPDDDLTVVILTNNFDSEIVYELAVEAMAIALWEE